MWTWWEPLRSSEALLTPQGCSWPSAEGSQLQAPVVESDVGGFLPPGCVSALNDALYLIVFSECMPIYESSPFRSQIQQKHPFHCAQVFQNPVKNNYHTSRSLSL